jgi:hypothetical protein
MKTIKNNFALCILQLALIIALALSSSSCKKLLEEEQYGAQTVESLLANPANLPYVVGQAYADVKWLHDHWGYWGINTLTADECVVVVRYPAAHWDDGGYWKNMHTHLWTPDDDAFENIWNQSISGAVLCNRILQTLDKFSDVIEPQTKAMFTGELEGVRSYYFFTLFDAFGRIPYTEEYKEDNVPLMSAPEIWHKLVDCLERNAPNMQVVSDGNRASLYGRVTQGFAYALLARLYLNAESYGVTDEPNAYNKCVVACDKIINAGSYSIENDYFANFKIKNENSKENIFVIVEDGNAKFDARYIGSMMNKMRMVHLTLHYCHQQAWNMKEKPWNGFCAPPDFMDLYATADRRGPCPETAGTDAVGDWGWFVGPIKDQNGNIIKDENKTEAIITKTISADSATWNDGARLWKYEVDKTKSYDWGENDFVLFRYADVLYMKGEAIARGGSGAFDWSSGEVAKIRTRIGLPAYASTPSLDEILNERGREFTWECVRRRDLIRFHKFAEGTWWGKQPVDATRNWFPIPQPVIEKSTIVNGQHLWTQNPGY